MERFLRTCDSYPRSCHMEQIIFVMPAAALGEIIVIESIMIGTRKHNNVILRT